METKINNLSSKTGRLQNHKDKKDNLLGRWQGIFVCIAIFHRLTQLISTDTFHIYSIVNTSNQTPKRRLQN